MRTAVEQRRAQNAKYSRIFGAILESFQIHMVVSMYRDLKRVIVDRLFRQLWYFVPGLVSFLAENVEPNRSKLDV